MNKRITNVYNELSDHALEDIRYKALQLKSLLYTAEIITDDDDEYNLYPGLCRLSDDIAQETICKKRE